MRSRRLSNLKIHKGQETNPLIMKSKSEISLFSRFDSDNRYRFSPNLPNITQKKSAAIVPQSVSGYYFYPRQLSTDSSGE